MSLRTRLITSYTLIVILCLGIVAVAVSVMLQGYRDRAVMASLNDMARPIYVQVKSLAQDEANINEVWKNSIKGPVPFVIVGNKADLRHMGVSSIADNLVKELTYNISQETHKQYGFGTKSVITSAKTGENIREAFRLLAIQIIAHTRYLEKSHVI